MVNYPNIDDGKALAKKYGLDGVIIVALRADETKYCVTSYGRDKGFCILMKQLGKVLANGAYAWANGILRGGGRLER